MLYVFATLQTDVHIAILQGKHYVYQREYKRDYKVVQPNEIFAADPSLGIRDVALQIINLIKCVSRFCMLYSGIKIFFPILPTYLLSLNLTDT